MADRGTRRFANRTALVTGGVRRVGLEIARALAREGARVVITYHTSGPKEVKAAVADLKQLGATSAAAYKADLRHHASLLRFVKTLQKKHPRVDYLINSAASFIENDIAETTVEEFDASIALNLRAPFFLAQALAPAMKENGFGRIVNIADVAAYVPWPSYLAYSVSKGGLVTLTKGLAKALAPEILVNAVAPGPVLLPEDYGDAQEQRAIQPTVLKRAGAPEDVAAAVIFLLESDYITGVTLPVDGGRLIR